MDIISKAQKDKLYYESLFCACYKADLSEAVCRNNGITYRNGELKNLLPIWFKENKIPRPFRYWLMDNWIVHIISEWLIEAGYNQHFPKKDIIANLNRIEADFCIKKFIAIREKIQKGLKIQEQIHTRCTAVILNSKIKKDNNGNNRRREEISIQTII